MATFEERKIDMKIYEMDIQVIPRWKWNLKHFFCLKKEIKATDNTAERPVTVRCEQCLTHGELYLLDITPVERRKSDRRS